ncbi:unnamed protein product [Rhodiola kirilowii]
MKLLSLTGLVILGLSMPAKSSLCLCFYFDLEMEIWSMEAGRDWRQRG